MEDIRIIFIEIFVKTMEAFFHYAKAIMPKAVNAFFAAIIGWLCAVIIKKIVSKTLRALGTDVISEKSGLKAFLEKRGMASNISALIGCAFYWVLIAATLMLVFNILEISTAYEFLKQAISYIPKIIAAIIIMSLGVYLSRLSDRFISTAGRLASVPFYKALGRVSGYGIMGIAIMISLEYLGIATTTVTYAFMVLFALIPIACVIVFISSGKNLIANMLCRNFIQKKYSIGDNIEIGSVKGEILSIDLISTTLKNNDREIVMPNSEIIGNIVRVIRKK